MYCKYMQNLRKLPENFPTMCADKPQGVEMRPSDSTQDDFYDDSKDELPTPKLISEEAELAPEPEFHLPLGAFSIAKSEEGVDTCQYVL